ncbi:glycoside hydrolase family 3 C-terminal domain-containing protein [Microbacterium sp. NPDC089189]|uniref:glycoside hydrolase family 3 protein n=1 Tax=Microbacterium sp. NPDC089189 TaxID=3154972 RepID=UPI003417FFDC
MVDESTRFARAVAAVRGGAALDEQAAAIVAELTREERLWLLDGDQPFWAGMGEMMTEGYNTVPIVMGALERVGLPGLRFSDGPRGVVLGHSTAFPVSMARGATWDVALEEQIGRAIGREMRAQGANFFGGVCINLPRHPAWGRAQETYGDDPVLLGEFGAALIAGVQRNAMAVAKHYALNSMENARFTVDVTADDATLHEVYLPHFRRAVEAGVSGIMTAYNSVNGAWAGQNEMLMEGVLREAWGFEGVTVSDFIFGLRDAGESLRAGLDVEEPFRQQRAEHLVDDIAAGRASWEHVDRAALRIVRTQLAFFSSDLDPEPDASVVFSDAHRSLARTAAATSMVLLQNDAVDGEPLLPLDASSLTRVALIGRLADVANTGDFGSSNVRSPEVVTARAGMSAALPNAEIAYVADDDPAAAADAAADADVAVVVVGYTALDEGEYLGGDTMSSPELQALFPPAPEGAPPISFTGGGDGVLMGEAEGGDRASLRLRPVDVEIIRAAVRANPRTVVVIVTAGAVITEEWRDEVPALLIGWYSGSEGGNALADVLLGAVDAAGRLPYAVPTDETHLPAFDRDAVSITYDRWHGQRLLDRDGHDAAFPLGFGLSYTSFALSDLSVSEVEAETFTATVTVANTGHRAGRHVVQLYGVVDAPDFPRRVLLGFLPVALEAGASARLEVTGSIRPLQRWTDGGFRLAASAVRVEAAAYSGDPSALAVELTLD